MKTPVEIEEAVLVKKSSEKKTSEPVDVKVDGELEGVSKTIFEVIWLIPLAVGGLCIKLPFIILGLMTGKVCSMLSKRK